MRAVVVANGELDVADERRLSGADVVIAADGGAATLGRLGVAPRAVVGDLDSLPADVVDRLAAAGVGLERHPAEKDASDAELAVAHAAAAGAAEVTLLAALGGDRLDHEIANLLLVADPRWRGHGLRLERGSTSVRAVHGGERLELDAAQGDLVSLLPVGGDATGVVTDGLRYPLAGGRLAFGSTRGLSNEVVAVPASVSLEHGSLLVVEILGADDR